MQIIISLYFYRKSSSEAIYLRVLGVMIQITGKNKDGIIILFSFLISNSIQE